MTPLVFFGSSPFSVVVLDKLLKAKCLTLIAVVTKPDKPVGRGLKLTPNPVKVLAQKNDVLVIESLKELIKNCPAGRDPALREKLKIGNLETVGLVAAYGTIIPQEVITVFDNRLYNIHPSLLPKYRGPAPLQQQILDGITETGVTIIQLDAHIDHGPIVAQEKDTIRPEDTWITLGERLFQKGVNWFIENYLKIENCELKIQNHSQATYTKLLTRQDGFVPYAKFTAALASRPEWLDRMWRAFHPWPGVWTTDPQGQRQKLVSLSPLSIRRQHSPKNLSPVSTHH